ncbi:hypothetical protein AbraIFM66951_008959 [Aspergillus brasiliensis]|nr:hypothetical protein AbraIFM66951_008959 [Aspergillus brasiliensis]
MNNRTEDEIDNLDVKADILELEYVQGNAPENAGPTFSIEDENRVYRKLDWNLMPLIFVLYSLSVLDRSNLGNAKIAGMEDDVDLSGRRPDHQLLPATA